MYKLVILEKDILKTTPDNELLFDLVDEARKGKIALPQFQRNFVWSRDDITALLVSILEGHFIGSFLLLKTDSDDLPFAARPVEGVELKGKPLQSERLILDGQQRLTSLHYAFAAPELTLLKTKYPYRFFLNLDKVTEGDWEEAVFSERADEIGERLERNFQYGNRIIPFTVLEEWDAWLNAYEQWLVERDHEYYFNRYFKIDKPAWTKALDRIRNFPVPTLVIPKIKPNDPLRIAEVCAIFEKMNSSGVRLSVYDLLTARLYKDGVDQHTLWEEIMDRHPLLNRYSDGKPDSYGVFVLRTIGLMRGLEVRGKSLINLSPINFESDFRQAGQFMEKALQRLTSIGADGFGVFDSKWMPYTTMVPPLAAMLWRIHTRKLDNKAYTLMRRWYWASVFTERYAGAVETTTQRDYQDFLKAVDDPSYEPLAIHEARLSVIESDALSLRNVARVNSIYRGVMCLIALRGAKDFLADDSIEFHTLEDHHIFPRSWLDKSKSADGRSMFSGERVNSIVNRTLISDRTNKAISNRSPGEYLENLVPTEMRKKIMDTHFIGESALWAMAENDYEAFLVAREAELRRAIVARLEDN